MKKMMSKSPLALDLDHILDHTRDLWDQLRGERLFITGGTGFFGCWLLKSFLWINEVLRLDAQATVLTRYPDAFIAKAPDLALAEPVTLLQGDTQDFAFPAGTFSYVIHAATETSTSNRAIEPLQKFTSNIDSTRRVLEFAVKSKAVKVLLTSSGAVYGKQPSDITHISEAFTGAPEITSLEYAYGQSKRVSEFLCSAYAQKHGFDTLIARCFAFVGPHLPLTSNYAIGNFIRDALNRNPVKIDGDGTPYRSYLYAADLTIWLWTILFRGRSSHPYNVGSENDLTIAELANEVIEAISPGLPVQIAKEPPHNLLIERYVPSTQRARNELGLREFINLNEAINRTANWYAQ